MTAPDHEQVEQQPSCVVGELAAGGAMFFDGRTYHTALPNTEGATDRCSLTVCSGRTPAFGLPPCDLARSFSARVIIQALCPDMTGSTDGIKKHHRCATSRSQ